MGIFGDIGDALFGDEVDVDVPGASGRENELRVQHEGATEDYWRGIAENAPDELKEFRDPSEFNIQELMEKLGINTEGANRTSGLMRERLDSILRGDTSREDTATDQDIERERKKVEADLSAKMGPNWRQSTAGVQSLRAFNEWAERSRSESRLNQQSLENNFTGTLGGLLGQHRSLRMGESGLGLDLYRTEEEADFARTQAQNNQFYNMAGLESGAIGMLGNLQNPYRADRNMEFSANAMNASIQQANQAGALGLLTAGIGAAAGPIGGMIGGMFSPRSGGGSPTLSNQARWSAGPNTGVF